MSLLWLRQLTTTKLQLSSNLHKNCCFIVRYQDNLAIFHWTKLSCSSILQTPMPPKGSFPSVTRSFHVPGTKANITVNTEGQLAISGAPFTVSGIGFEVTTRMTSIIRSLTRSSKIRVTQNVSLSDQQGWRGKELVPGRPMGLG